MKESYKFYQKITAERGLTSYQVSIKTGVPQSTFSLWKNHGIVPKWKRMVKIAQFLSTPEKPLATDDFYRLDEDSEEGMQA